VPPQQVPPVHTPPLAHAPVSATHLLLLESQHPLPLHMLPAQQAAPGVPHAGAHVPAVHVSPFRHIPVFATHLPFVSQQPPFEQTEPGQHVCVLPPQFWHVPPTHVPVVHGMVSATHWLPPAVSQQPPPMHTLPAQQAEPEVPHSWHDRFEQTSPVFEHCALFA
jgi:hypothetical protein